MRLNLEWLRDDSRQVPLEIVIELANERLGQLKALPVAVRIFFDEIEVSLSSANQFRRDAQIIRDFIVSIARINQLCMQHDVNIRLIAAIRTEVIRSAFATGKEIYELIEDYGKRISWFDKVPPEDQPLLHVIESKIKASEKSIGLAPSDDVWRQYFTERIKGKSIKEWIVSMTWCRPRDIVRLLTKAADAE